jgi:hypothetical protein
MIRATLFLTIFFHSVAYSQKIFFKSNQQFTEDQLKKVYSSVYVTGEMVFFNAVDYSLYVYNWRTANQLWAADIHYKTNTPVFVSNNRVYSAFYENDHESTAILDATTGTLIKKLPVGPLATTPHEKNGMLYGTAIYEGGCVFAYDIKGDSLRWFRFIAHGVSTQPYYQEKEMRVNAESDNWFRIGYNGQLLDTNCKNKADMFVQDIPCISKMAGLTHDGRELKNELVEKLFSNDSPDDLQIYLSAKNSFLYNEDQLIVLGDKLKTKASISIPELSDSLSEVSGQGVTQILKADDKRVWLLYNNWLVTINYIDKKAEQLVNLTAWQPHRAVLDEDRLWVISGKDGLLYGFTVPL